MPYRVSESWAWPAAVVLGFAGAQGAVLAAGPERGGGLAAIAAAAVVAAFVGIPLAGVEWTAPREGDPGPDGTPCREPPWMRGASSMADLWSLLLVGALAGPLVRWAGTTGIGAAALAWALLAIASRARGGWATVALACLLVPSSVGVAAAGLGEAPPWGVLEPRWETWREWLPDSVAAGTLLAAAGFGQWSGVRSPIPGRRRVPWTIAGLGLLVALCVLVRRASWWEITLGDGSTDLLALGVVAVALLAAASAVLERDRARAHPWAHALAGLAATLWFAWPAREALDLWWGTLLPLGQAAFAVAIAFRVRGSARWIALGAAVLLSLAAFFGWTGLPMRTSGAAAAAATVVFGFWAAGTMALVGRKP